MAVENAVEREQPHQVTIEHQKRNEQNDSVQIVVERQRPRCCRSQMEALSAVTGILYKLS